MNEDVNSRFEVLSVRRESDNVTGAVTLVATGIATLLRLMLSRHYKVM